MASLLRTDKEIMDIYNRQVDTVYRISFSFMKTRADTEDMVQETFLRLMSSGNGFYVAVRQALDLSAVADRMFSQTIESALAEAKVKYNDAVYGKVDVGSFYTELLQARQELASTFSTEDTAKDDD